MNRHKAYLFDASIAGVVAVTFGTALGVVAVLFPLMMVAEGYDVGVVGVLAGLAAVAQFVTRLYMRAMLRSIADRYLIGLSSVLIAATAGFVMFSTGLVAFILAQILHGVARGLFWTAAQTHAVRMYSTSVRGLSGVSFTAGVGTVVGPLVAGLLVVQSGPLTALMFGVVVGAAGGPIVFLLANLKPLGAQTSSTSRRATTRNEGVVAGSWMSFTAGSWKAVLDAYVPVVLAFAAYSEDSVGLLIAAGNLAVVVGSTGAPIVRNFKHIGIMLTVVSGIGLSIVGVAAPYVWMVLAALVLSGASSGALQTLGPSIGADSVAQEHKSDALAIVGVYRAGALMATPLLVAVGTLVMPVGYGVAAAGLIFLFPVRFMRH